MRETPNLPPERDVRNGTVTAVWGHETLTIVDADAYGAARTGAVGTDALAALDGADGPLHFALRAALHERCACVVQHRPVASIASERVLLAPLEPASSQRWRIDVADVDPGAGMIGARNDAVIDLVSHELRSPLNAALTWASVLEIDRTDATIERAISVIKRNIHEQARLIDDLVDAARSGRPTAPLDTVPTDLTTQLVRAASDAQARHPGYAVHVRAPASTVAADEVQLQRALRHLIDNAVKFAPNDRFVTLRGDRAGAYAIVEVTDAGCGLTPDELARVFDSFWRADTNGTGGGLGLGVVRTVVERHRGAVAARSAGRGRGATFTIALPISA